MSDKLVPFLVGWLAFFTLYVATVHVVSSLGYPLGSAFLGALLVGAIVQESVRRVME